MAGRGTSRRWCTAAAAAVGLVASLLPVATAGAVTPGGPGSVGYPSSVACVTDSWCWATRTQAQDELAGDTLARWDLHGWSVQPLPSAAGSDVNAITCPSREECWAVGSIDTAPGYDGLRSRLLRWDGRDWSEIALPISARRASWLTDVSCSHAADCLAVGTVDVSSTSTSAQAWHWNGRRWRAVPVPHVGRYTFITAASCSTTQCMLLARVDDSETAHHDVALRYSRGRWSHSALPAASRWRGLTCATAASCWVVGEAVQDVGELNAVAHWDGHRWSRRNVPQPGGRGRRNDRLLAVRCAAPSDCWAVGGWQALASTNSHLEALHWDGRAWRLIDTPTLAGSGGVLTSVACRDHHCLAGGLTYEHDAPSRAVYLHWTGSRWRG